MPGLPCNSPFFTVKKPTFPSILYKNRKKKKVVATLKQGNKRKIPALLNQLLQTGLRSCRASIMTSSKEFY